MNSYNSVMDSDQGYLSENWEEFLWSNLLSPNPETSNTSSFEPQFFDTQTPQVVSEDNDVPKHSYQLSTAYQNVEISSLLSPAWEDSASETPQNCTNMSTYFSTFDPSYQFQEILTHQSSRSLLNLKTQNAVKNRKMHSARINLVPTGNGTFKAIIKRKRKRTVFTTEQIEALEEVFSVKPYVTREERQLGERGACCNRDSEFETGYCLICGEAYSDSNKEDWIECLICKMWAHVGCVTRDISFICINCNSDED